MMATPPPQSDLPDAPVDTGDAPAAGAIALPDDSAPAGPKRTSRAKGNSASRNRLMSSTKTA